MCTLALTVNGESVTLSSGSGAYAAIDTGTTLIGGPNTEVANIYAQISGSEALSGSYDGYYSYREFASQLTVPPH